MKNVIGIYHGKCADGATAAAVLLSQFPEIALYPLKHRYKESELEKIQNKVDKSTTVYIVDFALREGHTEKIISNAKQVINIDHHIGVVEQLKGLKNKYDNFDYVFDNNKSGSSLTWIYFNGSKNIPEIIKLVEDFDIRKFEFGDRTKYIASYFYTMQDPEIIIDYFKKDMEELIEKGKITNAFSESLVESLVEKIKPIFIKVENHIIPAFNTSLFYSELGNILSKKMDKTVILYFITGDKVNLNMISKDHHSPSSLEIAKIFNGGGHKCAAGAETSLDKFLELIQK